MGQQLNSWGKPQVLVLGSMVASTHPRRVKTAYREYTDRTRLPATQDALDQANAVDGVRPLCEPGLHQKDWLGVTKPCHLGLFATSAVISK